MIETAIGIICLAFVYGGTIYLLDRGGLEDKPWYEEEYDGQVTY